MSLTSVSSIEAAAQALHDDITQRGRTQLRDIHRGLPIGSEVRLQFMVVQIVGAASTAPLPDRLYNARHVGPPISGAPTHHLYDAATVILRREARGTNVQAAISSYEHGTYQRPVAAIAEAGRETAEFGPLVASHSSDGHITVQRVPVMGDRFIQDLAGTAAHPTHQTYNCDEVLFVARSVAEMFREGIPLPSSHTVEFCTFDVTVRLPNGVYQQLLRNLSTISGLSNHNHDFFSYGTTGHYSDQAAFQRAYNDSSGRNGMQAWETCGRVVEERARPIGVPEDARERRPAIMAQATLAASAGGAAAAALQGPQDNRVEILPDVT